MKNIFESWQKSANIMHDNRLPDFQIDITKNLYPPSRQPLVIFAMQSEPSPAIDKLRTNIGWILQQSLYLYLHEITGAETKIICSANGKILCDDYSVIFDNEIKKMSATIGIDESFHSLAALDAINQLEDKTGVKSLVFTKSSIVEDLLNNCYRDVHPRHRNDFQLIVTCILENTITKDLDLFLHHNNTDNLHPFFLAIVSQHFRDEARHSIFAYTLLAEFWAQLDEEAKSNLTPAILFFVDKHLEHCLTSNDEFTELLLNQLQISDPVKKDALAFCYKFTTDNMVIIKQTIFKLFDRLGIATLSGKTY